MRKSLCKMRKSEKTTFQWAKVSRLLTTLPRHRADFRTFLRFQISDQSETFQTIRILSRLFGHFPCYLETFQTVWKLSRRSGNFPDGLDNFQTVWKFPTAISRFMRKNFLEAQKLSGRQCHDAMIVFGPLSVNVSKHLYLGLLILK